jgi:hypothetical protein
MAWLSSNTITPSKVGAVSEPGSRPSHPRIWSRREALPSRSVDVRRSALIDHGEAGLDRRAVPGIDRAVDGRREDDGAALLEALEVLAPGRAVRGEARLRDGDEAPALGEPRQRRRHMPERRVGATPVDMGERRERRVHQHHGGRGAGVEMVVDAGGIEARDADIREEMAEQAGARLGELVQDERGAGKLGEDGEQPGAGRRLEDMVGGDNRRGRARDEGQRNRRRELLQLLALDRAPRVAGEQPRHPGEHRQQRGGRSGARRHGAAVLAQEQHRGRLAGVVGALPVPAALRVGGADGVLHRGAKDRRIDRLSALEGGQQQPGGVDEGGGAGRCVGHGGAGRGKGCRGGGGRRHDGSLG